MIKLTEEMVIARTRLSDLGSVKKLNCWGADLQDVTLLRKMPNVEVLALSVNQIKTLADFQHCPRLQELYIRKNDIRDLREVCYLKGLPHLKNLWLADNPCTEVDGYRLAVLRALPQLEKLDDVAVKPEEVQEAARVGRDLMMPMKRDEEVYSNNQESFHSRDSSLSQVEPDIPPVSSRRQSEVTAPTVPVENNRKSSISVTPSPDPIEVNPTHSTPSDDYAIFQSVNNDDSIKRRFSVMSASSPLKEQPTGQHSESVPSSRRSSVATSSFSPIAENSSIPPVIPSSPMEQARCPVHHTNYPTTGGIQDSGPSPVEGVQAPYHAATYRVSPTMTHTAYSTPQHDSYVNEGRNHYEQQRPFRMAQEILPPRNSTTNSYQQQQQSGPMMHHSTSTNPVHHYASSGLGSERSSPTRSTSKNRNRTSNLLMATLCLVNELDYGSLEVVAMAIRNRLDELED